MLNLQRRQALRICSNASKESQTLLRAASISQTRYISDTTARKNASHQTPSILSALSSQIPTAPSFPVDLTIQKALQPLPIVKCVVRARIPTTNGTEMYLHLYTNSQDNKEHLAIVFGTSIRSASLDASQVGESEMDRLIRGAYAGRLIPGQTSSQPSANTQHTHDQNCGCSSTPIIPEVKQTQTPLVRIHSECYTGETVWSARCDCGEQLDESARMMGAHPQGGIIIYLRQEGRGIGLGEKLKAYNLQDMGSDTVEANLILNHPADGRSYEVATAMLLDLGQREIRLMTNNPEKVRAVEGLGKEVIVSERVPMVPLAWKGEEGGIRSVEVEGYLKAKIEKMSHML